MGFAPIRADRCILILTLHADDAAAARYAALRDVLKQCRLHPLDTTPVSQLVIVEAAAFTAQLDAVRALLGPQDMIHMISIVKERLMTRLIAPAALQQESYPRDAARRPPWLADDAPY